MLAQHMRQAHTEKGGAGARSRDPKEHSSQTPEHETPVTTVAEFPCLAWTNAWVARRMDLGVGGWEVIESDVGERAVSFSFLHYSPGCIPFAISSQQSAASMSLISHQPFCLVLPPSICEDSPAHAARG